MLKVCFDFGRNPSGDSVRGIGVHTKELISNLRLLFEKSMKVVEKPEDADILHITKFNPFLLSIPLFKPTKKMVLTIHDLIPLIYPKHYPPGLRGRINFLVNKFLIWKNVDAIITISETSKKDICRFLGVKPEKVFVTYLGVKKIFKKIDNPKYEELPKDFALYIGDINYNKNIPNLVKACDMAKIPLVIVGKQAKEIENMDINHPELIHLKGIDFENVVRLGFIDDSELVNIINLAKVYVQPSFYEGFGLSSLEALFCGVPVVASKTQCLVEILGDTVIYFDPKDPGDMAQKIKSVKKISGELPRDYSFEKCAKDTVNVYKLLLND